MDTNSSLIVRKRSELEPVHVIEVGAPGINAPSFDQLSLLSFWRVMRKRKWVIASCVTITVAVVAVVSILMPRRYDAVARINLDYENSNSLGLEQLGISTGLDATTKLETQLRIVGSDTLAWDVIGQLRLDENPAFAGPDLISPKGTEFHSIGDIQRAKLLKQFHKNLNALLIPKTQIIEVRFRNHDPKLAAAIVNAIAKGYIERNFKTKYEATMQASDWLARQIDDLRQKTESSEEKFTEYQKKTGILGVDESHNIVMSKLDELNKEVSAAQADRIVKEARYRTALTGDAELIASIVPESTIVLLRKQEAEAKIQYGQLAAKYGTNYPRLVQAQEQLEEIQSAIGKEVKNLATRLENDYKTSLRSEQMLTAALETQKQEAYRLNEDAVQYGILLRDVQSSRDLYEGLLKKLKEAGITAGLTSSRINIVDPASTPIDPAEPKVPLNIALGLLGGLLGGIAMAFVVENVDNSIRTPDDVESRCALPSLGVIPSIAASRNGHKNIPPAALEKLQLPVALEQPKSAIAEAFRALRTSLLLASAGSPPKVIVITSAAAAEGKTTTAINCGIVLAQSGYKVLLVDADMRRPMLHNRMNLKMNAGLSGCLAGTETAGNAYLQVDTLPTLSVLPSGKTPPYPSEMITSETMRRLMDGWKNDFDHIIIDTPPALAVTDAVVLSSMADATVVVARSGKTGHQSLRRVRDLLQKVNARIAGVVVNDLALNSVGYAEYYGTYGTYYHGYHSN